MSCICDYSTFSPKTIIQVNNLQYCCPKGSTLINGSCGCDSTGANKTYLGTADPNFRWNLPAL